MSVYKPEGKPAFHYDFQHKGRRFHGSTGQRTRRAAEAYEDRVRREVAEGKHGEASQLTLSQAAARWFREHGSKLGEADRIELRLEQLLKLMGRQIRLAEITTAHVSDAIQARMAMTYRKTDKDGAQEYLPRNATVNRDVIGTLRPILNRATSHWGAKGLEHIDWRKLRLAEPAEHIRTFTDAERTAWLAECGPATGLFLDMLLTYGPRFGELFFPLHAFDADGPRLTIDKRKRDVPLIIPLLDHHAAEIKARLGRATAAGRPTIWYVEVANAQGEIELEPIPYYGMQARLKNAAKRAGVKPGRLLHSTRHHAGTTILRETGNLKLTQMLLGHADIKSTMRYAHAVEAELRQALAGTKTDRAEAVRKDRRRSK